MAHSPNGVYGCIELFILKQTSLHSLCWHILRLRRELGTIIVLRMSVAERRTPCRVAL